MTSSGQRNAAQPVSREGRFAAEPPAPRIVTFGVMNAHIAELQRWIFLMQQVHEASYFISRASSMGRPEQFATHEGVLEFSAYFRAALNSYAKCFIRAGPGRKSLNGKAVYRDREAYASQHERLIMLRNKYSAHSDENELEGARADFEETEKAITVRLRYEFKFPFDRLYELRDLIKYLEEHIVDLHAKHVESVSRQLRKSVQILQGEAPTDSKHTTG